jgi:LuxR family maltose regulon positive regulatory protein
VAVGHALAAKDVEGAAILIERIALATVFQQGAVLLVRRLVERLPLAVVYTRPHLTLVYGITLALSGQFDAMEALLLQGAPALNSLDLPDVIEGGLLVLHSTAARFRGDSELAIELAQQALHQLPVDVLALRAGAALNMGAAYLQRGERAAASQALADAITLSFDGGAAYLALAALEELATDQMRQGHLVQAKQTCEQALARVTSRGERLPAAGLVHVSIGEVLVEWNELEPATQALTLGIQLLQGTTETGMLVRGYSALARRQWADGAREAAFATLQQGEAWLANTQVVAQRAHAWLAAQRARLHLWQNNLPAALGWEQETHATGESPLSYLQQLTRVRVRLAQHTRHPQASSLQEAINILAPLLSTAKERGWGGHVIEILMLQALIEQASGQRVAAQTTLMRALTLAEPEGYLRLFVDEGEAVQRLISDFRVWTARQADIQTQAKLSVYADKLLTVFLSNQQPGNQHVIVAEPSIQDLVEPLSARELEVLQLVAVGLSNTQIAARLIVTTGTVKTHINHIFGKLDVQSRTQAVARARGLGMLNN